jgi:IclR family transcriptional regulator, acetate operon repressor
VNKTLDDGDKRGNSPVLRALKLFAYVAQASEPPMLAELSRAVALPKPTSYRLALLLEGAGYLYKDPQTLRYSVGPKFEDVALCGLRNGGAGGARRLIMEGLAKRLGSRVNFVVLRAGELEFVEWVESTSALRVDLRPETRVPAHCSASGKLLMAHASEALRRRFLKSAPFRSYTRRTITTARALEQEFERIRSQGYGEDNQEFIIGVNCLAVPVRNELDEVVAALATMAPVATLPLAAARERLPDLRRCGDAISAALGWRRAGPVEREGAEPRRRTPRKATA